MSISRRSTLDLGDLSVRLAVALAFADASIAVLALPQIVDRLHTSISHVTWVIIGYNVALILTTLVILPVADRLADRRALIAGLGLFGLASIGSGVAGSLSVLVVFRCLQGVGAGILLCSSLPLFARGHDDEWVLHTWATTAAIGAAAGPAIGGLLTQLFDWRAIFLAQAPVAAAAALAALGAPEPTAATPGAHSVAHTEPATTAGLTPARANLALLLVSAGLIGALFLATVLLIDVWQLTPLAAALVLAVIPVAAAVSGNLMRERSSLLSAAAGAVILAVGLVGLALTSHREIALAVIELGVCGLGLGLAFPALTRTALATRGSPVARAGRTVAAREAGLVLGLVLLTPILVGQLNSAPQSAVPQVTREIVSGPGSLIVKFRLGAGLLAAERRAPQASLPDLSPAFASVSAGADPALKRQLAALQARVTDTVQRAVTRSFRRPLLVCALLSLLALVPLAAGLRSRPLPGGHPGI